MFASWSLDPKVRVFKSFKARPRAIESEMSEEQIKHCFFPKVAIARTPLVVTRWLGLGLVSLGSHLKPDGHSSQVQSRRLYRTYDVVA